MDNSSEIKVSSNDTAFADRDRPDGEAVKPGEGRESAATSAEPNAAASAPAKPDAGRGDTAAPDSAGPDPAGLSPSHPNGPACFSVHMSEQYIFDMLLYHMYSTFAGFLMNLVGLAVIMLGGYQYLFGKTGLSVAVGYFFFGILLLAITPLSLKMRAGNTMRLEKYRTPIKYCFDDDGIDEVILGGMNHYSWSQVKKAISTPKTITFYMEGDADVLIFPKQDFDNETFQAAMWYLSHHVVMGKIYIH